MARSGGQAGSSRQTPGCSSRSGAGRVLWRTNTVTGGPSSTPLRSSAQPAVPPAGHLRDQVDPRPGQGGVGGHVAPGPEQQPGRRLEPLQHPEGAVAVAVGPAGDQHRRAGDPLVARPQRALTPVRPVGLLLQPPQQPRLQALDPLAPPLPPVRPGDRRDRRQGVQGDHVQRVVDQVEQLHRPAGVVHVVGVAVVTGVDGDDRLQRRWPLGRHLERVEPRVAGPVHPDRPGRPRLVGQPPDHPAQVGLLARRVLVGGHPLRRPRPPQVHPGHRVPVLPAQPLVLRPVRRGGVILPIRQRLQHHRRRSPLLRPLRQVQAHRQPHPVLHRDPAPPLAHAGILPAAQSAAQCSGSLSAPSSTSPSCSAKSAKSRRLRVSSGSPLSMQQAAIQVSFSGRVVHVAGPRP